MEIIFSEEFKNDFQKIKDKTTRLRIIKQLKKLAEIPEAGKPLKYEWKNHRSLRIPPCRIIYRLDGNKIVINCFDHRKEVYN
ncbi:type II toxin-antitoxin system RelE/ParE family toxin [Candidatus Woesearchaeota archaeon]|nr:type II toxin-antitoxin system RelE/ParE family toxin [Candidatus Woesearchaeota archaeon]